MNYLITGASGLLGYSIIKKISRSKTNNIACLIHNNIVPIKNTLKNIKFYKADITNPVTLRDFNFNSDIIIHCAGAINEIDNNEYYRINLEGTKNLIEIANKNKIKKFIYISSWAASEKGGSYAKSKLLAENEVKKFRDYLIIRPADLFDKNKSHLFRLVDLINILPVVPILAKGNYLVSPLSVDNLADAIIKLSQRKNLTITITGPDIYTYNGLVTVILNQLQKNKPVVHLPHSLIFPFIYLLDKLKLPFIFNIEKYTRLIMSKGTRNRVDLETIGIKPVKFIEILDNYIKHELH